MRFLSLRSKLLLGVSALVIGFSLIIGILALRNYSVALRGAAIAEARNVAHSIALEATDNILVNDLVTLQRTLDHYMRSNPSLSYLFIMRGDTILAHTFEGGVPVELIAANSMDPPGKGAYMDEWQSFN